MQDYEIKEMKSKFKDLFDKDPDENLSAFIAYINSVKLDSITYLLVELEKQIKDLE
ncbi:hypothetical protein [Gelidibacter japonicus]|uniref:hypothetical protein n=1 Tax=Gelidibacter japonicus TaxID=1962232 RepID=UPI003A8CD68F